MAMLLTLCSAVVLPAQIWITKLIIDRLAEHLQGSAPALPIDWYAVLTPVGALVLVWASGIVCQTLSVRAKDLLSILVRHHTEYLILQKGTQLDIAFFESSIFYDQMDMVQKESYRTGNLAWRSLDLLGSLIGLSAMLGLLLQLHPLAIVVLLLTSVPRAILGGYFANRFYGQHTARAAARRMAAYIAELLRSRDAIDVQHASRKIPIISSLSGQLNCRSSHRGQQCHLVAIASQVRGVILSILLRNCRFHPSGSVPTDGQLLRSVASLQAAWAE